MIDSGEIWEIDAAELGPRVLVLAGVHGDEYEPMIAAYQLKNLIGSNLKRGSLTIIPIVNKSAFSIGARCGEDGLDLARNCPGDSLGSITLQHAANVAEHIKNVDYLIDMHTGGQLFDLFPLAGYMLHQNETVLEKQRQMARAFGLPLIWGTDPFPEGRTLSIARDHNIPAIYVEFGGPGPIRKEIVGAYIQGCLNILSDMEMLDLSIKNTSRAKYFVEDDTEGAGYLQGKMASPRDGIFESSVSVGDHINEGDRWGVVYDAETLTAHDVFADSDGLVLFIRAIPKVKQGDSLGGILKINS